MTDANVVLQAMGINSMPGVYVLGCLERRVTLYAQQTRALNLIDALLRAGKLTPGDHIAVVGAGVAGLTAAAAAAHRQVQVTLLEKADHPLPRLSHPCNRWLHPNVYDWPRKGWSYHRAHLPLLDWQAGEVPEVFQQLIQRWRTSRDGVVEIYGAQDVQLHPRAGAVDVSWNAPGPGDGRFPIVILAVGFGLETPRFEGERSYWEWEDLDEYRAYRPGTDQPRSWMVSGCGDGALTDLLRLCLRGFRHAEMLTELVDGMGLADVEEQIRGIEADPRASDGHDAGWLQDAYLALQAPRVVEHMRERLRADTDVWLNCTGAHFIRPEASALNRFLVAQLSKAGGFKRIAGKVLPSSAAEGARTRINFDSGHSRVFDRVVLRHGPRPALADFPKVWDAVQDLRAVWRRMPGVLDQTRDRIWDVGAFGPETRPDPDATEPAAGMDRFRVGVAAAFDLDAHIDAVGDAVLRMGGLATRLSTAALDADGLAPNEALIVLVAHRYGHVPQGAARSVEWQLVDRAAAAGAPVFAFVVDADAPWTLAKEQDTLVEADDDQIPAVMARVRGLARFKAALDAHQPVPFGDPGALAQDVAATLAEWRRSRPEAGARRMWQPHIEHPLQPALHFQGRAALLDRLSTWWQDPASPDRVMALVAIGGTGKTAVAEKLFGAVREQPQGGGVFVWSFYEAPDASAFLRAACAYFTGEPEDAKGAGGRLERLKAALRSGEPHLLIMDGLETIQATGGGGRSRGQLEDATLRQLLQSIAGELGQSRALVTSRFPLADLERWRGAGAAVEDLSDLDPEAARAVLRAWAVKGADAALDALAEPYGRHALSVNVLGSFLHHFGEGDPTRAPAFDLDFASVDDPLAAKLQRLLAEYAAALDDVERQLMARLSVFPRGVGVELLNVLVDAGGEVAGVLVRHRDARLLALLERLRRRGLAFAYGEGRARVYSAHPFLRQHFAGLLDVPAEQVHEAVRATLAPGLDERPSAHPTAADLLDRYERLIEHTRLAGRVQAAFDLYWYGLGGYMHLGKWTGEYARGARILAGFSGDGSIEQVAADLPARDRSHVINDWGLFAMALGEIGRAERCYDTTSRINRVAGNAAGLSATLQNLASAQIDCGQLIAGARSAAEALTQALAAGDSTEHKNSLALCGHVDGLLGRLADARAHFAEATALEDEPALYSGPGVWEAEHTARTGDRRAARAQSLANLAICERNGWGRDIALLQTLLGRLALPDDVAEARRRLALARVWSDRTGEVIIILRAHGLAAEIGLAAGDVTAAADEARDGVHLADTYGFGLHAIDLRLDLARAHLARAEHRPALKSAREALDLASAEGCGYAWGIADAAHLCGRAHQALGERDHARRRFGEAIEIRARIEHPGLEESRAALDRLGG